MIIETAAMSIQPGREEEFEQALAVARTFVESSPGCRGLTYQRGVERPSVYLLLIRWDTVADHLQTFRNSEAFTRWRQLLSPLYAEPAVVEHWEAIESEA